VTAHPLRLVAGLAIAVLVAGCGSPAPAPPSPAALIVSPPPVTCGGQPFATRWWDDRVFYEVFVRSFADSDGDGIGDLRGLTDRLDDLNDGDPATSDDLGVTGIWLMPVAEATSYHGYDVTDYRKIERDYGTRADFEALLTAAHRRGIKVIVDLVLNHTSIDHPWFQASRDPASPKADWYRWSDTEPGDPGAWHALDGRWYLGQFWSGMPDLDLENPEVTAELVDTTRWWLDEFEVDGFRLDAIRHLIEEDATLVNTPASRGWLADFRSQVLTTHPDTLFVGEVFDITAASSAYVREGGADLVFDFPLARGFLQAPNLEDTAPLAGARVDALELYPRGGYAAFLTNHDQNRAMTELGGSVERAKLAAALLLTDPGLPFIYYGEEIGVGGRKPDERLRLPMPWTAEAPAGGFSGTQPWQAMGDDWPDVNVAAQRSDPGSLLATYRALVALRSAHPALWTGASYPLEASTTAVSAVLRATPDESLVILANLGLEPLQDLRLSLETGPLCGVTSASVVYATAGADGTPAVGALGVEPPATGAAGGFDAWIPVAELPARSVVVVRLVP
jgi:glycosidase